MGAFPIEHPQHRLPFCSGRLLAGSAPGEEAAGLPLPAPPAGQGPP